MAPLLALPFAVPAFQAALLVQAALAFWGDYLTCGRPSVSHCIDRVWACTLVTATIVYAFTEAYYIYATQGRFHAWLWCAPFLLAPPPLLFFYLGKREIAKAADLACAAACVGEEKENMTAKLPARYPQRAGQPSPRHEHKHIGQPPG